MKTLIIGAGRSGVAAANHLAACGEAVVLADLQGEPVLPYALDPRVERAFGREDEGLLDDVAAIVVSPGVPQSIPLLVRAASKRIPVTGEIELAWRELEGTVIAVTGSNGKSTTTALIGEILGVAGQRPVVAGNIGEPLIRALDMSSPRSYVLELSSFQLETVETFHADVALLLNITPDHMDRYATLDDYVAAKHRIFRNQMSADVAIVNADLTVDLPGDGPRVWRFCASRPVEPGAFLDGESLVLRVDGTERRIPRAALRLQGLANVENALAAWLAARAVGVDDAAVEQALATFAGLPHRMVLVRERGGVRWINDSKGTNVDATLSSLRSFGPRSVVLILGGKDKAGEFERMRELVTARVRAAITIGRAAGRIAGALEGTTEIVDAGDLEKAVRWAAANARPGETVLLSPACASFDQYRNFEHRGDHFESLVEAL